MGAIISNHRKNRDRQVPQQSEARLDCEGVDSADEESFRRVTLGRVGFHDLIAQIFLSTLTFLCVGPIAVVLAYMVAGGNPSSFHGNGVGPIGLVGIALSNPVDFIGGALLFLTVFFYVFVFTFMQGYPFGIAGGVAFAMVQHFAIWLSQRKGIGRCGSWFSVGLFGGITAGSIVSLILSLGGFGRFAEHARTFAPNNVFQLHLIVAYLPSIICGLLSSLITSNWFDGRRQLQGACTPAKA